MSTSATEPLVAVIGGGVVGCAVAHALARRGVRVVLLEAQAQLATGASATNSGIMHTGFDSPVGTLETRLILRSAELRAQLQDELGLELWQCGALMRARTDSERAAVAELAANARVNGVEALLERDGSLRVPGETLSDPLAYVRALAAAAEAGGAELRFHARVQGIARGGASSAGGAPLLLSLGAGEQLGANAVVNCAGLYADEVARLAGDEISAVYPRKGEFLVFSPPAGAPPLQEILLPVPSPMGKGVLVFPTLDRSVVIAGPTAREREDKEDWSVEGDARELILERAVRMYPPLVHAEVLGAYAGLRPAGREGANYAIERSGALRGLVHMAAIRSTGLSASLAIGELVTQMLAQDGLVELASPRALRAPRAPASVSGEGLPWWRWGATHRAPSPAAEWAQAAPPSATTR